MTHETVFFVSPSGDDSWSGRVPEPDRDGNDGPFATLTKARDAVRSLLQVGKTPGPVAVELRHGTYRLAAPLLLGPGDCGGPECPAVWRAYRDESPVVTGLWPLGGEWEKHDDQIWKLKIREEAPLPRRFRQLFVDGCRLERTRVPTEGRFKVYSLVGSTDEEHRSAFQYLQGDVQRWHRLEDAEFVFFHSWSESRLFVEDLDESRQEVRFTGEAAYPLNFHGLNTYYVENVFEALERPGQWYLDWDAGTLYVIPPEGVDLTQAEVTVGVTDQLLRLEGEEQNPIRHVSFEGLTFAGTEVELPATGYANHGGSMGPHYRTAAITCNHAENVAFNRCRMENTATYAVELRDCSQCRVERSTIREAGGGGVILIDGEDNSVCHCHIHDCGRLFFGGTAIVNPTGVRTRIAHNLVHHLPYCGIRGGNWAQQLDEIIEFNHVHHVMLMLDDGAGIFNAGVGSVIRNNLVHDCVGGGRQGYALGLYLDEFRTGVRVLNNIAYRTGAEVLHLHNNNGNTIENNILAFGGQAQISWTVFHGIHFGVRKGKYRHPLQTFQRNIVYWTDGCLSHNLDCNRWDLATQPELFDYNLYWKAGTEDFEVPRVGTVHANEVRMGRGHGGRSGVGHDTLADWQELGLDAHSLNADPLFADPENGDFALPENSPAFLIGFKPIDLTKVGPQEEKT